MENKVILVTGSSSGLGKAAVIHFASIGAKVVVTGRNEAAVNEVAEKCKKESPSKNDPLRVVADLTVVDDIKRLVKETVDHFGRIDVLVNNAGVATFCPINDASLMDKYGPVTDINLRAPLYMIHLCEPYLQQSKGCIVNVSSQGSIKPYFQLTLSCMAKAGMDMMTKCLSMELGPKGIRVNAVCPGFIPTALLYKIGYPKEMLEHTEKHFADLNPLKRNGTPMELVNAIEFLASEKASWINGAILPVDGGSIYSNA